MTRTQDFKILERGQCNDTTNEVLYIVHCWLLRRRFLKVFTQVDLVTQFMTRQPDFNNFGRGHCKDAAHEVSYKFHCCFLRKTS